MDEEDDKTPVAMPTNDLVKTAAFYIVMRSGFPADCLEAEVIRAGKWVDDQRDRQVILFCQDPRFQQLVRLMHFLRFAGISTESLLAALRMK